MKVLLDSIETMVLVQRLTWKCFIKVAILYTGIATFFSLYPLIILW